MRGYGNFSPIVSFPGGISFAVDWHKRQCYNLSVFPFKKTYFDKIIFSQKSGNFFVVFAIY